VKRLDKPNRRRLSPECPGGYSTIGRSPDNPTCRAQRWIDAALASGPEEPFSQAKFADALKRGLRKAKSKAA